MPQTLRIRSLEIPADFPDLTELEKNALIRIVEERYGEVESQTRGKVVDTARLSLLTAVTFAHELLRLQDQVRTQRNKDEQRIDEAAGALQDALQKK